MSSWSATNPILRRTKLFNFHKAIGKAKCGPFAGWDMPIQYEGIVKEHNWCRQSAGLFDVSHMCQVRFWGGDRAKFLEWVTNGDVQILKENAGRLATIMMENGGIKDDCIITKYPDHCYVVINAGCAHTDIPYLVQRMEQFQGDVTLEVLSNKSLLALQGPKAVQVLSKYVDGLDDMLFLRGRQTTLKEMPIQVTRCGYTGEDGFEISMSHQHVEEITNIFLSNPEVKLIGLGARDTLRMEAGLNLYGHEMNEDINPVQAGLTWTMTKRRRAEGGFLGYEKVKACLDNPEKEVPRVLVGLTSAGGPSAREKTIIQVEGQEVGIVTSGGPCPTSGKNIALAYIDRKYKQLGTKVNLMVRNKVIEGEVSATPFIPAKYYRGKPKA